MFCVSSVSWIYLLNRSCSKHIAQVCMAVNCGRLPIPLLNSSALLRERLYGIYLIFLITAIVICCLWSLTLSPPLMKYVNVLHDLLYPVLCWPWFCFGSFCSLWLNCGSLTTVTLKTRSIPSWICGCMCVRCTCDANCQPYRNTSNTHISIFYDDVETYSEVGQGDLFCCVIMIH